MSAVSALSVKTSVIMLCAHQYRQPEVQQLRDSSIQQRLPRHLGWGSNTPGRVLPWTVVSPARPSQAQAGTHRRAPTALPGKVVSSGQGGQFG